MAMGTELWRQHDGVTRSVAEMGDMIEHASLQLEELYKSREKIETLNARVYALENENKALRDEVQLQGQLQVLAVQEGQTHASDLFATDLAKITEMLGRGSCNC